MANEVLQQTVEKAPEKTPENLMPEGQMLFTIEQTATILAGISTKTVRRLIKRGLLEVNPALRIKLIPRQSIEKFVKLRLNSASPVA